MWRSFLIAGRLLTRLPLPDPGPPAPVDLGRSAVFYPLVGLVIGLLLWGLASLLADFAAPYENLAAVLVLAAWVWLTGGLHLDGLADTADAWIGGMGDRDRTLEIMKDPSSGPFGVTALVLALLCKWAAVSALLSADATAALIWIPVFARAQLPILFLTTPYARQAGMAAEVSDYLPPIGAWASLAVSLIVTWLFLGLATFALFLTTGLLFVLWRRSLMVRLNGYTGDAAGALVELSEVLMLVVAVLLLRW